jgi:hypothetical protein
MLKKSVDRIFQTCIMIIMNGVITKKHFFLIAKAFGLKIAIKVLLSRKPVALTTLMGGE